MSDTDPGVSVDSGLGREHLSNEQDGFALQVWSDLWPASSLVLIRSAAAGYWRLVAVCDLYKDKPPAAGEAFYKW